MANHNAKISYSFYKQKTPKPTFIVRFMRLYLEKVGKTSIGTCEYVSISD